MNIDNYKTIENNILIAEFMGAVISNKFVSFPDIKLDDNLGVISNNRSFNDLHYNTSWDWLMKVVEQIERFETVDVDILQYGTKIHNYKTGFEYVNNIANISFDNKIEHTYDAVVDFIKNLKNNIQNF